MERRVNSNITCILDACTIINLINIDDEDDFLINQIGKHLDVFLSNYVFKEVRENIKKRAVSTIRRNNQPPNVDVKDKIERIDRILPMFLGKQIFIDNVEHELGDNYHDDLKKLTGYGKTNGEFYSVALSLYLSRATLPNLMPTKLFFHTDDYPAKDYFDEFFKFQQIGYIEDTADLLLLLYRIEDLFTKKKLDDYLSRLFSEYATENALLIKDIKKYKDSFIKKTKNDFKRIKHMNLLITKLESYDFDGINKIKEDLIAKKKLKSLHHILENHKKVFELETKNTHMLKKLRVMKNDTHKIYCI